VIAQKGRIRSARSVQAMPGSAAETFRGWISVILTGRRHFNQCARTRLRLGKPGNSGISGWRPGKLRRRQRPEWAGRRLMRALRRQRQDTAVFAGLRANRATRRRQWGWGRHWQAGPPCPPLCSRSTRPSIYCCRECHKKCVSPS